MRRAALAALLVCVAAAGLWVALSLPSDLVRDCPPPSTGLACITHEDTRPWLSFLVGAAALGPLVALVFSWSREKRYVIAAVVTASAIVSMSLWRIAGLVPTYQGDCPPYPRCYTVGHPYAGPAFVGLFGAVVVGILVWPWHTRSE